MEMAQWIPPLHRPVYYDTEPTSPTGGPEVDYTVNTGGKTAHDLKGNRLDDKIDDSAATGAGTLIYNDSGEDIPAGAIVVLFGINDDAGVETIIGDKPDAGAENEEYAIGVATALIGDTDTGYVKTSGVCIVKVVNSASFTENDRIGPDNGLWTARLTGFGPLIVVGKLNDTTQVEACFRTMALPPLFKAASATTGQWLNGAGTKVGDTEIFVDATGF